MDAYTKIKNWRQELHQIPEIGLQEIKTTAYLQKQLEEMGYAPISILETGTLVYIDNGKEETIAFRSDIDALKMEEKTGISFASKHSGYMHACGHDGHMSALLGVADALKAYQGEYRYNILLIFQPAEESPGGARLLVEKGILQKYHVKAIFGMHLMPSIEQGMIACRPGPLMAQNGELDVTIYGKSAHAGLYHLGIDTIVIASQLITEYQAIVSRMVSPMQPCVIHIGEIHGGSVRNIVADKTQFHGTVRAYDEKVFLQITDSISKMNRAMENIYGCTITCTCPPMYPPVLNDEKLYQKFVACTNEKYIELKEPMMLAEDFAYYQKEVPGIFFFIGTKSKEYQSGLHTETFNFHEEVLLEAVNLYFRLATTLDLGEK